MYNRKMTTKEIWKKIWPVLNLKYKRTKTFLNYKNPWELTVAVILSAQTTDEGVNKVTPALFKRFPKPADMANASLYEIEKYIKTIGLYKSKAKYIKQSA